MAIIKHILSMLVALAIIPFVSLTATTHTEEGVGISFSFRNITDERLVELVENGEMPHNVTELWLNNNQITDISPLSTLTSLESIRLDNNQITDISPLAKCIAQKVY